MTDAMEYPEGEGPIDQEVAKEAAAEIPEATDEPEAAADADLEDPAKQEADQ